MKIEVLHSAYRVTEPHCMMQVMVCVSRLNSAGHNTKIVTYGSSLLKHSRNQALASRDPDTDFVLLVDDDMKPETDAALKLLRCDAPVASAICTTRDENPVRLVIKEWDRGFNHFKAVEQVIGMWPDDPERAPVTGPFGVGAAFLMIRKDAIDQLIEHYLSAKDWMEDNRPLFDRMHVRSGQREAERQEIEKKRRKLWADERYCRVFCDVIDNTEMESGEDIGFSTRLIQCGIPVTLEPTVIVTHEGRYSYGLKDYNPMALYGDKVRRLKKTA